MRRTLLAAVLLVATGSAVSWAHSPTPCSNSSTAGGAAYTAAATAYPLPVAGHAVVDVYMGNKATVCSLP